MWNSVVGLVTNVDKKVKEGRNETLGIECWDLPIFGHQAQVEKGRVKQLQSQKGDNGPCHSRAASVQGNI